MPSDKGTESVLLYGCQVYHYSLPDYLSLSLERVQKRALKIIYGYDNHYREVLQMAELKTLRDRREDLCLKFFNNIVSNPLDCLYHLLPFDNRDLTCFSGLVNFTSAKIICEFM